MKSSKNKKLNLRLRGGKLLDEADQVREFLEAHSDQWFDSDEIVKAIWGLPPQDVDIGYCLDSLLEENLVNVRIVDGKAYYRESSVYKEWKKRVFEKKGILSWWRRSVGTVAKGLIGIFLFILASGLFLDLHELESLPLFALVAFICVDLCRTEGLLYP